MFESIRKTKPFRVYNSDAPNKPTMIFGGVASGIRSWGDLKHSIFYDYKKKLFREYWIPEEVPMGSDNSDFREKMNEAERKVYLYSTGTLNWLDSIASDIVALLFMCTSDSALRSVLALIAGFETMHNESYEYIAASVLTQVEKEHAFNSVRKEPLLMARNNHIIEKLQVLVDALSDYLVERNRTNKEEMSDETLQALFEGIIAYQVLEGQYFAGGFVYFHSLARDNKMLASNGIINLIKADENYHSEIFGTVLQILMAENPQLNTQENLDYAVNFIKEGVELEKAWSDHLYEDIDTLSVEEYHNYTEYLANLICRNGGMEEPFPENSELKAKWVLTYGSKEKGEGAVAATADFLQSTNINYNGNAMANFDL